MTNQTTMSLYDVYDLCEKAKEILVWKPEHNSLEEIISTAWNWLKNHPNGF